VIHTSLLLETARAISSIN